MFVSFGIQRCKKWERWPLGPLLSLDSKLKSSRMQIGEASRPEQLPG